MKTRFHTINGDNQYRFSLSSLPLFAGNFAHGKNNSEYTIYDLDDFDQNFTKHVALKQGEKIFRCDTEQTRNMKYFGKYLVKINLQKGLVYFLEDSDAVKIEEKIIFERKGSRVVFINLLENHLKSQF